MLVVELGEERFAIVLDRRTGCTEPLPQFVGFVLGQARPIVLVGLPAGEEGVESGGRLLPLGLRRVFRGQSLGFDDDLRALGDSGIHCCACFGGLLFGELFDGAAQFRQPLLQRREVADRVG